MNFIDDWKLINQVIYVDYSKICEIHVHYGIFSYLHLYFYQLTEKQTQKNKSQTETTFIYLIHFFVIGYDYKKIRQRNFKIVGKQIPTGFIVQLFVNR